MAKLHFYFRGGKMGENVSDFERGMRVDWGNLTITDACIVSL